MRSDTPAEITQLPSGDWIARRLGLCGIGKTQLQACADLTLKETNQGTPDGLPPVPMDAETLAAVIAKMHDLREA
jgi:hypothetical protein